MKANRYRERGITLLELLMVLALLAGLMGVGIGVFSRLELGRKTAAGLVKNVLRTARAAAMFEASPARVHLDASEGTLQSLVWKNIGTWHFEKGAMEGAYRITATNQGVLTAAAGRVGAGLAFTGAMNQWVEFPVEELARFQVEDGIRIDLDLYLDQLQNAILISRKESFQAAVTGKGEIEFEVFLQTTPEGGGGIVQVKVPPGFLLPRQWHHLTLSYDGRRARVSVDGREAGSTEERGLLHSTREPILLSRADQGFEGKLDEVQMAALVPGETVFLPQGVAFGKVPPEIHFDEDGSLDPRFHLGPVAVGLVYDDRQHQKVEIGIYGTIR